MRVSNRSESLASCFSRTILLCRLQAFSITPPPLAAPACDYFPALFLVLLAAWPNDAAPTCLVGDDGGLNGVGPPAQKSDMAKCLSGEGGAPSPSRLYDTRRFVNQDCHCHHDKGKKKLNSIPIRTRVL